MKKFSALLILLLLLPIVVSKSYKYDYINVNVTFEKDGSVLVEQERAYDFRGEFSMAYLDLLKKGAKDIEFISIKDEDLGVEPAYEIENDSRHLKITWYYKANNEIKRFKIDYRIIGAVEKYEDVAQFYWKIIEDEHAPINKLSILFILPESSSKLFKIFVHSSAEPGKIEFNENYSQAEVKMSNVYSGFVETRVLMSPDIFQYLETKPIKNYENILSEERKIFLSSSRESIFNGLIIFIIVVFPITLAYIYYYLKYGKEYKLNYDIIYEREPPSKIPPLALINLFEQEKENTLSTRGFLATIFDLARRGYIEIYEIKKEKLLFTVKELKFVLTKKGIKELEENKDLKYFEFDVLNFLFREVRSSVETTTTDIKNYIKNHQHLFNKFLESINDKAHDWLIKNHFKIYEDLSEKKKNKFLLFTLIYGLISCAILYLIKSSLLVPAIMFFVILYSLAYITLSKKTEKALLETRRWEAFKRFISDFSAMKTASSTLLYIWDEYLVYAIALGVAEELLKNMQQLVQETKQPISSLSWYHSSSGKIDTTYVDSLKTLTNISNALTSLSAATSAGGGFSGGGGGGGGGGSSGAR
jgi:uncharacterized membrane protein